MYADEEIRPWFDALAAACGPLELFDAHTHIGSNDPDGFSSSPAELLEALELAGARAVVFPMQEPDGYRDANDRVIAEAAASDGRLVAFCRVDPRDQPAAEAERCLAAGARGIKLHPRAERFALGAPEALPVFRVADEHGVPVLVHAGRGIPALGRDALEVCERFPRLRLILAHAGISDLSWLWARMAEAPNLFFDTSWWSVDDLVALTALVPPGRILFGSDAPYGTPLSSAVLTLRCPLELGLDAETVRMIAGGQLERLVAGEEPQDLGPAPGQNGLRRDVLLDRVHAFLVTATARMIRGAPGEEALQLAMLACEVPEDSEWVEPLASVRRLAEMSLAQALAEREAAAIHLACVAQTVVRTPSVPLPELD